jgi:hypothetical protein
MAVLTSSTLDLYCWSGKWSSVPSQPQYVIRKTNPDTNNLIRFELSELIQDYIDVVFNDDYTIGTGGVSNIKSSCWFYFIKRNTYSDRDAQEFYGYGIGTKGYTYFEDGLNSTLSTSKLFSNTHIYLPENANIKIPVYIGPGGVKSVRFFTKDSSGVESIADTESFDLLLDAPTSEDSNTYIRYASSNVQASKIEIESVNTLSTSYSTATGTAVETVYPIYTCEPKYTNYKISFINKFGAIQDFYFNKKRTDDLQVKRDDYSTSTISSSSSGVVYNTYDATKVVQDVATTKSLTLNTGFLKEEYNEIVRQLFQSENVWIRENNKTLPVKIKDSNFSYKTQLNDKLVNYTVQFEYAFDGINNIR